MRDKDEKVFVLKRLKNVKRLDLFEREVNAVRAIDHPNIPRVVDFDLKAAKPYFVSEYCERGSLTDIGADSFKGNVAAAVAVILEIARLRCTRLIAAESSIGTSNHQTYSSATTDRRSWVISESVTWKKTTG